MQTLIKIFNSKHTQDIEKKINEFLSRDGIILVDIKYSGIPSDIEQWKDEQTDSFMMRHDCIFTALVIYTDYNLEDKN